MWSVRFSLLFLLVLALFAAPPEVYGQGPDTPVSSDEVTGPPAALAQPAQVPTAPEATLPDRMPPARTLRAYWHVFIAFALVWVLVFGYVLTLGRRLGGVEREIEALRRGVPGV